MKPDISSNVRSTNTVSPIRRRVPVPDRYSLVSSLATLRAGPGDPTMTLTETSAWWARWTAAGPTTLRLQREPGAVVAYAWGPGADEACEGLPGLLGQHDDPSGLVPAAEHRTLARAARTGQLRMPRTGWVGDILVQTILEQKVTARGAHRSWSSLVRRFGRTPPGPGDAPVRLAPPLSLLAGLPYHRWHPIGVERRRAETVARACRHIDRIEEAVRDGGDELERRLRAIRGIGPWTASILRRTTLGDPDAVEVGDWNLPNLVTYNLAGERRGDDVRMLELLEPYRGQRGRVVLLLRSGGARPPRRTHRWEVRDIRTI